MDENERTESIRQLQRALRTLHKNGSDIPEVKEDGIFGAETTAAVKAFQKSVGMEQTGEVDFQTWKNIMNETRACIDRITPPFLLSEILTGRPSSVVMATCISR